MDPKRSRAVEDRKLLRVSGSAEDAACGGGQRRTIATASQAAYRCFTSIADFQRYVQTELVEAAA